MFYRTSQGSGLRHDPWMMCVVPRPIGWISSISRDGVVNLAPYSFFNAVAEDPPMVMFATNGSHEHGAKDTASNIRATGEFVCNMATVDLATAVKLSSAPLAPAVNEFEFADLETEQSFLVKPPRVKGSPIHLECQLVTAIDLPAGVEHDRNLMIVGQVLGIHIDDRVLKNGAVDISSMRPLSRLGYGRFATVSDSFEIVTQDIDRRAMGNETLTSDHEANAERGD